MFKVFEDTKFYVYCPAGHASGGAELLHQLVSLLRDNGKEAFIILTGPKEHKIHEEYIKYNIATADNIIDNAHNIEVLYEPEFYRAKLPTRTQKILWWLSVDNFFYCSGKYLSLLDIGRWSLPMAGHVFVSRLVHKYLKRDNSYYKTISLKDLSRLDIVSAYQSEYAQHFLQANGFREMFPLKDYINIEHCDAFSKQGRKDVVLYNPKKGIKYTKKLIKMAPDIEWVPIENMTRAQVIEKMRSSKIYIDFGNHPGKDRLPRECAMNGLCVITGSRGAAKYFEDVWLENKYKFDEKHARKQDVVKTIRDTMSNYESCVDDFKLYRNRISLEKKEFENQVKEFFLLDKI